MKLLMWALLKSLSMTINQSPQPVLCPFPSFGSLPETCHRSSPRPFDRPQAGIDRSSKSQHSSVTFALHLPPLQSGTCSIDERHDLGWAPMSNHRSRDDFVGINTVVPLAIVVCHLCSDRQAIKPANYGSMTKEAHTRINSLDRP